MSEPMQPEPEQALSHPEEMLARVQLQVGQVSLRARARATPAGLVGIALVVLSLAALVWAARRPVDR
jgi:hypothetical protein